MTDTLLGGRSLLGPTSILGTDAIVKTDPLVGGVARLRWILPVRTPQDQQQKDMVDAMVVATAYQISSDVESLLHDLHWFVPRVANRFRLGDGHNEDPDAVDPHVTPGSGDLVEVNAKGHARVDLGEGKALMLDADRGEIALDQHGEMSPLWGEARPDAMALALSTGRADYRLDNGAALSIRTSPAMDHANTLVADRITVETTTGSIMLTASPASANRPLR